MTEHANSTEVLVVGGGMAGLAGALALRENGANVTLVERAPEFGEVGAGLQMAPNASRVLKRWGLLEKALEIGVQPKHLVFRDAVTGEQLLRLVFVEVHGLVKAGKRARKCSTPPPSPAAAGEGWGEGSPPSPATREREGVRAAMSSERRSPLQSSKARVIAVGRDPLAACLDGERCIPGVGNEIAGRARIAAGAVAQITAHRREDDRRLRMVGVPASVRRR